jgi:hypothetical protein
MGAFLDEALVSLKTVNQSKHHATRLLDAAVGYMLKNIDNQTTIPTRVARTGYMVDARRRGVQGCCTISLISWVIGSGEVCWKHRAISDRFFK